MPGAILKSWGYESEQDKFMKLTVVREYIQ